MKIELGPRRLIDEMSEWRGRKREEKGGEGKRKPNRCNPFQLILIKRLRNEGRVH
jgi:hypothetical protein